MEEVVEALYHDEAAGGDTTTPPLNKARNVLSPYYRYRLSSSNDDDSCYRFVQNVDHYALVDIRETIAAIRNTREWTDVEWCELVRQSKHHQDRQQAVSKAATTTRRSPRRNDRQQMAATTAALQTMTTIADAVDDVEIDDDVVAGQPGSTTTADGAANGANDNLDVSKAKTTKRTATTTALGKAMYREPCERAGRRKDGLHRRRDLGSGCVWDHDEGKWVVERSGRGPRSGSKLDVNLIAGLDSTTTADGATNGANGNEDEDDDLDDIVAGMESMQC